MSLPTLSLVDNNSVLLLIRDEVLGTKVVTGNRVSGKIIKTQNQKVNFKLAEETALALQ